ncbi:MAG: NnrU family protein [Gammaproteobacteria bacterium]
MLNLCLATAFFLLTHIGIAGTRLRFLIVDRIGNTPYTVFYSVISTVGVVWLFLAFRAAPYIELWGQLYGLRVAALVTMCMAFAFLIIGLTSRPSTLFGAAALDYGHEDIAGIVRVTRHPILIGFLLWSVTHMIVNGDMAALILFGSLTILTAVGIVSMEKKREQRLGDRWADFAARTSVTPFLAILQGRNRLSLAEIGWWRPAAAVLAVVVMLDLHVRIIGVSPLPVVAGDSSNQRAGDSLWAARCPWSATFSSVSRHTRFCFSPWALAYCWPPTCRDSSTVNLPASRPAPGSCWSSPTQWSINSSSGSAGAPSYTHQA